MGDRQFEGFEDPKENWSKLPHVLIEALPMIETVSEFKVIVYILRHTWGYHDDEKRITLDEFANGRKRKNGSRIDCGTGLTIPSIRDGLKRAIRHGFIEHRQDASDKARVKNFYTLKMRGKKVLHPECKEDSASVKESIPRTEKETLETNLVQENDNAPSPQPPALDGQQRAVDQASGGTAIDPVQEVAKHLRWLCSGQGVPLPSSAAGKKPYLKAARALLEKTDPADWQGVCFAVDDWGEHPPQADEWRRDRTKEPGFSLDHIAAHYWKIRNRPEPEEFVLITKDTPDPLAAWWRDQQPLLVQFKDALMGAEPVSKENGTLVLMVPDSGREQLAQGGRLEKMESALGLAVEVVAGGPGEKGS